MAGKIVGHKDEKDQDDSSIHVHSNFVWEGYNQYEDWSYNVSMVMFHQYLRYWKWNVDAQTPFTTSLILL